MHSNERDEVNAPAEVIDEPALVDEAAGAAVEGEYDEVDPYTALEQDVLKWKDLAMRTAAEFDNFRKRTAREREESLRYANQSLLEDLLPILDNFEMGMMAAAQDKGSMIYIGMDMVRKQLGDFLENCGVKLVEAEGRAFDPNLHDAVAQEASEEIPEGQVLRVTRRGYQLRDRLLRPAGVVVSTGASTSQS
ncbi:MAG: nucleotide exchange factor GrpE [Akkermansiaceae bacterium]|jgi:molecular chaperone GrpE|nr:nucleotide exchange factor GrpE [Akkermansiaceae bacterium]